MKCNKIAFLFDLDGVLVDSESEYTRIWTLVESEFPTGIDNFALKIKGTTLDNILSTYFPDPEKQRKVENRLYELEGQMRYHYVDGARELLDALHERGIQAVLVTSSNDIKMAHLWEHLPELKSDFHDIISADRVTRSKPDPQGYLLGAESCGMKAAHCVVVEDSLQGVKAGKAAGAYVIGLAGTLPAETLRPYADQVVTSLRHIEIDKLVEKLS